MLYGNIIFIKKTGGDGSKYPVTEKSLKIGRSEDCLIRIYNTQVALEHCQLIIGDNGQAILKDLSKQTILNGNLLDQGEVILCHGDVFKVGERLARWEYLPTSRYCRQLLSPTGRLVAVVMPQQRSLEDESTPGTSASSTSIVKNTPNGGKRRYSEKSASESTSGLKIRKSSGPDLIRKPRVNLSKFLTGRHSLKTTKLLLPGTKLKDRKSISGVISSKTPNKRSRKSTLPSWKVNVLTPPNKFPEGSPIKSQRKSTKSPRSPIKNLLMDSVDLESEESVINLRTPRTPQKLLTTSEEIAKSVSKGVLKTPLKTITESPQKEGESLKLTPSFCKSPSSKLTLSTPSPKSVRLVRSETKLRSSLRNSVLNKKCKRLSVVLLKEDLSQKIINKNLGDTFSLEESRPKRENSGEALNLSLETEKIEELKGKGRRSSVKTLTTKTPGKTPSKAAVKSPGEKAKTLRVSVSKKAGEGLDREKLKISGEINTVDQTCASESDSSKNSRKETPRSKTPASVKSTPLNKTLQEGGKSGGKRKTSFSRKASNKTISSASSPLTSTGNSKSSPARSSRKTDFSKKKTPSRGVRRKLSPSVSSAERAAKKLKISSPKKPDKNKKAALLVLGKANRRQQLSQNVKVLLKQKIIKKAIKQSVASNAQQSASLHTASVIAAKSKVKKETLKRVQKSKKQGKKKREPSKGNSNSKSMELKEEEPISKEKLEFLTKLKKVFEEKFPFTKFDQVTGEKEGIESGPRANDSFDETRGKIISNQPQNTESPESKTSSEEKSSPFAKVDKSAENFVLSSIRRCSKRLSSKNDTGRPDFVELSPTALGLIPKNLDIFKTPNQNKRGITGLVTPKNDHCVGIIRSASTSKVGNRKSVRFSSKEGPVNSELFSPKPSEKTGFDFGGIQTPDVSVDVFVSPLGDKSVPQKGLNDLSRFMENNSAFANIYKSNSEPRKCVRKLLQSPQPSKRTAANHRELLRGTRSASKSPASAKTQEDSATADTKIISADLGASEKDLMIFTTPKIHKSSKSVMAESKQLMVVMENEKDVKGPKNDISDLRGVKKLLSTPKVQKSPKNDLSDVRGVKKLLATPKVQKSPRNDLSDVRGVKKLLTTPKVQNSPKNDLTDVRGVKRLLATPRVQKSPRNDLSDVRGVKKLLTTPKVQNSPKNDLTDVRGVRKLLATPKVQKSPRNDLSDVRGVKKLLRTPRMQRSPKNDLSDVRGVKKLLTTPKAQKSPENDLSDVTGVKELLETPKNELNQSEGAEVLSSPKTNLAVRTSLGSQRSPRKSLPRGTGVEKLVESPKVAQAATKGKESVKSRVLLHVVGTEARVPRKALEAKKVVVLKSRASNVRAKKSPKNDLSDVSGVRELFSRHEPGDDGNVSLAGVAQLFNSPEAEVVTSGRTRKSSRKTANGVAQDVSTAEEEELSTKRSTRANRAVKAAGEEKTKRAVRSAARGRNITAKPDKETQSTRGKTLKGKTAEKSNSSRPAKSAPAVKRSQRLAKETTEINKTEAESNESGGAARSRKRKAVEVDVPPSPPKTRRKLAVAVKSTSNAATGTVRTVRKTATRSKSAPVSTVKTVRSVRTASKNLKAKTTKTSSKVQNERSQTTRKKNPSESIEKSSPTRIRTARGKPTAAKSRSETKKEVAEKKVSKRATGRAKPSPVAKRSTRRK